MVVWRVRDRGKSSVVPLVVVSVVVLGLGGAVALMFGGDGGSRGINDRTATLSNTKQVALGMLMYASDYDDRFPLSLSRQRDLERAVTPYIMMSAALFRSLNPAGGVIEPNPNVAAVPAGGVMDPGSAVMLFETYDWPDGGRVVAFTDGHAKSIEGFDIVTDLEVELDEEAQRTMDELALELERSASAPVAARPLGMPGG